MKSEYKNIKIKLSSRNKKAVFEKMLELSSMGFNKITNQNEKLTKESPYGIAYLFSSKHIVDKTYVGWNNDYVEDQDYYDTFKCIEITEEEFLDSAYIENKEEILEKKQKKNKMNETTKTNEHVGIGHKIVKKEIVSTKLIVTIELDDINKIQSFQKTIDGWDTYISEYLEDYIREYNER